MFLIRSSIFCMLMSISAPGINAQNVNKPLDSMAYKKAEEYYRLAMDYIEKYDFSNSEKYFDSLYAFSKEHHFKGFELLGLMNKGAFCARKGKLEKALSIYIDVLEKSKEAPNTITVQQVKMMTMQNMAGIYGEIGSYEKAIEILEEALTLCKKQKENTFLKGSILSNISTAYSKLKNYDKAIEYQKRVYELSKKANHHFLISHSLANLSEIYRKKGDFNQALVYAKEAEKQNINTKTAKHKEDWIKLYIGVAFKGLQQLDSAKFYLLEAKKIAIQKNNKKVEMYAEKNLAEIYEKLKDFEKAQKSQKRYTELGIDHLEEYKSTAVLASTEESKTKLENQKSKYKTNMFYILVFSFFFIISLSGFIVYYIKKKKKAERYNKQLQSDYKWLQNQYISLKESMQLLAKEKQNTKKYKTSSLTKEDREYYMNKVLEMMEKEKPYLDSELTQADLAKKLQMNAHHLSEVLTGSFEKNFYSFINIYRVNNAQELLKNAKYHNYKIEAIGYDSGFNSKTSFNRVFKNITGMTPSQYRQESLII